nr:MAG TPA: hypothetical protein [Caudoviricetes sp.]
MRLVSSEHLIVTALALRLHYWRVVCWPLLSRTGFGLLLSGRWLVNDYIALIERCKVN